MTRLAILVVAVVHAMSAVASADSDHVVVDFRCPHPRDILLFSWKSEVKGTYRESDKDHTFTLENIGGTRQPKAGNPPPKSIFCEYQDVDGFNLKATYKYTVHREIVGCTQSPIYPKGLRCTLKKK